MKRKPTSLDEQKPTKPSLTSLPVGVLSHLAGFLDIKSFMRLQRTCKGLNQALRSCPYVLESVVFFKRQDSFKGLVPYLLLCHRKMSVRSMHILVNDFTLPFLNRLMEGTLPELYKYHSRAEKIAGQLADLQGKLLSKLKTLGLYKTLTFSCAGEFDQIMTRFIENLSKTSLALEEIKVDVPHDQNKVTFIAKNFKKLKRLTLSKVCLVWFGDAALNAFGEHKQLQAIDLSNAIITSKGLQALSLCPMQRLNLYRCRGFDDKALASFLAETKDLESLDATGTSIGPESLRALAKHKRLQKLDVSYCRHLDDKAFIEIAKLPLKKLHMVGSNVFSRHIGILVGDEDGTPLARKLEELNLNGNRHVTENDAKRLQPPFFPELKDLGVYFTSVEPEKARRLSSPHLLR